MCEREREYKGLVPPRGALGRRYANVYLPVVPTHLPVAGGLCEGTRVDQYSRLDHLYNICQIEGEQTR